MQWLYPLWMQIHQAQTLAFLHPGNLLLSFHLLLPVRQQLELCHLSIQLQVLKISIRRLALARYSLL
jgi:hypothetical protein